MPESVHNQTPVSSSSISSLPAPENPIGPSRPKPISRANYLLFIIALFSLGLAGYFGFQNSLLKKEAETQTLIPVSSTSPKEDIPTPQSPISEREISEVSKQIFPYTMEDLLKVEKNYQVQPSAGFTLIASLLSPDLAKVAYSEVSSCFNPEYVKCREDSNYNEKISCPECSYTYRLAVRDLESQNTTVLYEYSGHTESLFRSYLKLIKPVFAGVQPVYIHLPFAWTADNQSLITLEGVLLSVPVGGKAVDYYLFKITDQSPSLLGDYLGVRFNSDFSGSAILKVKEIISGSCLSMGGMGEGVEFGDQIYFRNLLDGTTALLLEGDLYSLDSFSSDNKSLNYWYLPLENVAATDFCLLKKEELARLSLSLP